MNVGKRATLDNATKITDVMGRNIIYQLLANDDPASRPAPKLPEVQFITRRLPEEMQRARQRLPRHVVE